MWMSEEHPEEKDVKFSFYKKVFTKCYNISFKHPQTDVCNVCTKYKQEIKDLQDNENKVEELDDIKEQLRLHEDEAKQA